MGIRNWPYLFWQGIRNIFKHKSSSFFCLLIMITNIFLFSAAYTVLINMDTLIRNAQETVGITVFFNEGLSDAEIQKIGMTIGADKRVSRMRYTSAEAAWESFKNIYFDGDAELANGFIDDNPLANSANYEIFLEDISKQQKFVSWVEGIPGVRKVNYSNVIAEGLSNVTRIVEIGSIAVLALLLVIAVSLIKSSISLSIDMRKDEIHIMRYVGATGGFILAPFLWQGFLIGFVGSAIPLYAVWHYYEPTVELITDKLDYFSNILMFLSREEIFRILLPVGLALGIGIGLLGSIFSIRKHIRV